MFPNFTHCIGPTNLQILKRLNAFTKWCLTVHRILHLWVGVVLDKAPAVPGLGACLFWVGILSALFVSGKNPDFGLFGPGVNLGKGCLLTFWNKKVPQLNWRLENFIWFNTSTILVWWPGMWSWIFSRWLWQLYLLQGPPLTSASRWGCLTRSSGAAGGWMPPLSYYSDFNC